MKKLSLAFTLFLTACSFGINNSSPTPNYENIDYDKEYIQEKNPEISKTTHSSMGVKYKSINSETGEEEAHTEIIELEKPVVITTINGPIYTEYTYENWEKYAMAKSPIVLYFHAGWCPSCVKLDKEISEKFAQLPKETVILKVDYDKEKDLRKQYDVTSQHSGVFLDGEGKVVKLKNYGLEFAEIVNFFESENMMEDNMMEDNMMEDNMMEDNMMEDNMMEKSII